MSSLKLIKKMLGKLRDYRGLILRCENYKYASQDMSIVVFDVCVPSSIYNHCVTHSNNNCCHTEFQYIGVALILNIDRIRTS